MRLLKIKIDGLTSFENGLEIDFLTKQRVVSDDKKNIYKLFENARMEVWSNNVLVFLGGNASGKTMVLKTVVNVMNMLEGKPINELNYPEVLELMNEKTGLRIEVIFFSKKIERNRNKSIELGMYDNSEDAFVYRLKTVITKKKGDENVYSIARETVDEKTLKSCRSRGDICRFESSRCVINRLGDDGFSLSDISVITLINKWTGVKIHPKDLLYLKDINVLETYSLDLPVSILNFFDPTIEYLKIQKKIKPKMEIRLKFQGLEEKVLYSLRELEGYLSSGTIKAINIYESVLEVLKQGGYLLIDELEGHFSQEAIAFILQIFADSQLNSKGAVLLFSTHFVNVVDRLERSDGVCIVRKEAKGIRAEYLSEIIKRNDTRKSDVYNRNFLGGAMSTYEAYMKIEKEMKKEIENRRKG